MLQPEYSNSIVNLMSSLSLSLGGEGTDYEPLAGFSLFGATDQPLVLLIIDGLGDLFLQSQPESFLCRHRTARLTSVFPATTATAVTSFFTGVAPQQHGITGWFTYFKELGTVGTVLPFVPRCQGSCLSEAGITPAQIICHGSMVDGLSVPCHFILPQHLVGSDYSMALSGTASRYGYNTLDGMFDCIEELTASQKNGLIVAYWAELDSLAHSYGIGSRKVEEHFLALDEACKKNLSRLAERGVKIIASADHGLIDTNRSRTIHVEDHPELAATLTLPLCGEPRCAFCYVRSDKREQFENYVTEQLGQACRLERSSELIDKGYFGKGTAAPQLFARVGEYALLMKENYVIRDRLLNEKKFHHVGVHGGLSEKEFYVPLITVG